jgi:hypothetical protein
MMLTHRFAFYPPATASASRGFLQARSCSSACLATYRDCTTRDASEPTSATQHVFDYEHPRLVDSRLLVFAVTRLSPRAGTGNRAFHDAQFASAGRAALFRGGAFSSPDFPRFSASENLAHEPSDRTSGTSVASPSLTCGAFARTGRHQGRQDCFYRVSVKITRCPQSEMPSIVR